MPDVLPTLGNTNWLLIVATKILEIGWMLLKTSTGGNPIRTTSSTSAGFDCKLNFVYIFCNLSRFISFSRLCPMGPAIFWRTGSTRLDSTHFISFHFISFQSPASVTHGHGTQALYWRCAKQKDRAKNFYCFKLENKASSRSAPPTTAVASLYTLDPQEFFGCPRRCGCSAIRGRRV